MEAAWEGDQEHAELSVPRALVPQGPQAGWVAGGHRASSDPGFGGRFRPLELSSQP